MASFRGALMGALAICKDLSRLYRLDPSVIGPHHMPGVKWDTFERLLTQAVSSFDEWSLAADVLFGGPFTRPDARPNPVNLVPAAVWSWTLYSRRVYRIPTDLQLILQTSTFDGHITIEDVELPFPSFIVELGEPLTHPGNGEFVRGFVYFLVPGEMSGLTSRSDRLPMPLFGVVAPSDAYASYEPVSDKVWAQIEKDMRRNKRKRFERLLRRLVMYVRNHDLLNVISDWDSGRGFALDAELCAHGEVHDSLYAQCCRLAWGLALYLRQIAEERGAVTSRVIAPESPPSPRRRRRPARQSSRGGVRLSVAEILDVQSVHTLDARARAYLREVASGSREGPRPHFRCAHSRRPPGRGQDPTAAKTVKVGAAIVMPDGLSEGEVPLGAESVIDV